MLIHEAGHFFVALAVRMRPRRFYIFFPPALVKTVRGGIEYGIGTIPLGGYVKIPGMHRPIPQDVETHLDRALPEAPWLQADAARVQAALADGRLEEARAAVRELRASVGRADLTPAARRAAERGLTDLDDGLSADAYWRAPAWKRIVVIFAGPATNLLFAVAALAAVAMLGIPDRVTRTVDRVDAGSPAAQAGLRSGDAIVAVDGRPVKSFDQIAQRIQASKGKQVTVAVRRHGQTEQVGPLSARYDPELRRYIIGYRPRVAEHRYAPVPAVGHALRQTGDITVLIGKSLGRIFTGSGRKDVSSVVGITQASRQAVDQGFTVYLSILALISLSLALLNLLPLLPLDGGHIAFSIAERIRRRPVPREAYERASALGIALVVMLFFLGLSNDIDRIRGG